MSGFDEKQIQARHLQPILQPPEPRAPYLTGNAYADTGMQCDASPSRGCFLQQGQRTRIVELFHGRVGSAHTAYLTACTELRIDELLEKEPSKGVLFELVLEAVGLVFTSALGKMFRALQATAERIVADAGLIVDQQGRPAREPSQWARRLAGIDSSALNNISKSLVSLMKKHVPSVGSAPKVGIALLDQLTAQSGPMFEAIREQGPALVPDDSGLLVLFDSFAAVHQTVPEYKEQIKAKLDRFKQTQVGDIGTHGTAATLPQANAPAHVPSGFVTDGVDLGRWPGGKRQLAIYRREFTSANNQNHIAAPLAVPPVKKDPDLVTMTDDDFKFVAMVPDEFAEVALRLHLVHWGTMPTEKVFTPWGQ